MATREELLKALAAADAAGATDDAMFLADRIRAMDGPAQKDTATRAKEEYNQMSIPQQIGTAATDLLYSAANAPYLGQRDKVIAGMKSLFGDKSYEENLAGQRELGEAVRARSGGADVAAEVLGGVATGGALQKAGGTVYNLVDDIASMPLWKRLAFSAGAGATEGAVYGGLDAAGRDADVAEGINSGGIMGGLSGGAMEGLFSLFNRNRAAPAPTVPEITAEAKASRKAVDDIGVEINPEGVAKLNETLQREVVGAPSGPRRRSAPGSTAELDALLDYTPSMQEPRRSATRTISNSDGTRTTTTSTNGNRPRTTTTDRVSSGDVEASREVRNMMPDRGMTLYDLDEHRKAVNAATKPNAVRDESLFGAQIKDEMDKFARGLDDTTATAANGKISDAVDELENARMLEHRKFKLKEIGKTVRSAERRAEAAQGKPQGTQLRNKAASILEDERKTAGYTPDEIQQLEDIVAGSWFGNRMRGLANVAKNNIGQGVGAATGATIGSAVLPGVGTGAGAVVGLLGAGLTSTAAGKLAERSTIKQANKLMDTIARGGKAAPKSSARPVSQTTRADITRLLTLLGLEDEDSKQAKK